MLTLSHKWVNERADTDKKTKWKSFQIALHHRHLQELTFMAKATSAVLLFVELAGSLHPAWLLHPVPHCWPGCWHRGESSASCAFLAGLVSRALHVNMLSLNSPLKSSSLLWPKVHLCARHITRGVKNLNKKLRLGLIVFKIFNWLRLPGLSCSTWAMNSVC